MSKSVQIEMEMPEDLARFQLPGAVQRRLQHLLDIQDQERPLSRPERDEAEGLVNMAEMLTLLKQRSERAVGE